MNWKTWNKLNLEQREEYNYRFSQPLSIKIIFDFIQNSAHVLVSSTMIFFIIFMALIITHEQITYDPHEMVVFMETLFTIYRLTIYGVCGLFFLVVCYYIFFKIKEHVWIRRKLK